MSSAICFNLNLSKTLSSGNELSFYQKTTFHACFKLKEYAGNKIDVTKKLKFVLGRIENLVRKEKMLVTSIFAFSHNVLKGLFFRAVKSRDCVVEITSWLYPHFFRWLCFIFPSKFCPLSVTSCSPYFLSLLDNDNNNKSGSKVNINDRDTMFNLPFPIQFYHFITYLLLSFF